MKSVPLQLFLQRYRGRKKRKHTEAPDVSGFVSTIWKAKVSPIAFNCELSEYCR